MADESLFLLDATLAELNNTRTNTNKDHLPPKADFSFIAVSSTLTQTKAVLNLDFVDLAEGEWPESSAVAGRDFRSSSWPRRQADLKLVLKKQFTEE